MRAAEVELEAKTGKVQVLSVPDRHGRPVIILDNTAENTKGKEDAHMRFLAWSLERSIRKMSADVEKHVVFLHLGNFSIWNAPAMSETMRTVDIFSTYFHERLGHAVLWQPPAYFSLFLKGVWPFIDSVTRSKVVVVRGEYGPGTENDERMRLLLGLGWRALVGVDQPRRDKGSSPGYDHEVAWGVVVKEEEAAAAAAGGA